MLEVRRTLVWDYEVPNEPEKDEGFVALYVGRVLDRGTAEDARSLGLDRIRRYLEVAPARREVKEFWRWWLGRERNEDGDTHPGTAALPPGGIRPGDPRR